MMPKETTKYTADETGCRISNIPYDKYLSNVKKPEKYVTVKGLSESASAEENTSAINEAIGNLSEEGGGVVYIPKGTYEIAYIYLESNITLFIDEGAELVSYDYHNRLSHSDEAQSAVIYAEDEENIAVTGGGTITGQGESYTFDAKNSAPLYALKKFNLYTRVIEARKRIRMERTSDRPSIINFTNCVNVKVDSVRLKDSAWWTCVLTNCFDVVINRLVIDNNMHVANADGIDITGGDNFSITNCFIATADDAICLKPSDGDINDVNVSSCAVCSFANCFKIGTESQCDILNVTLNDCEFFMPDGITGGYSGIAIESADGANIRNINIKNIDMTGVSGPILIWLGNRLNFDRNNVGSISHVTIENVTAKNIELPVAVVGVKTDDDVFRVKDVTLNNISLSYRDSAERLNVKKNVFELSMKGYPEITRVSHVYFIKHEFSKYWSLPCYAAFLRHTENLKITNFTCVPRSKTKLKDNYIADCVNLNIK